MWELLYLWNKIDFWNAPVTGVLLLIDEYLKNIKE